MKLLDKSCSISSGWLNSLWWDTKLFTFKHVYSKSKILEKHRARGSLTMWHTSRDGEREQKISPTEQKLQKHLCNWSCMTEVVLVLSHSHCSRCCSPNIQPVCTSLRYGFSRSRDAWCCRGVWVKGRRRGVLLLCLQSHMISPLCQSISG